MELTTCCPACGTCFPVTATQLQLRKGYVRCVGCAHIFDGYDAVVPDESVVHRVEPYHDQAPEALSESPVGQPPFIPDAVPDMPLASGRQEGFVQSDEVSVSGPAVLLKDEAPRVEPVYGDTRPVSPDAVPDFLAGDEPDHSGWLVRTCWQLLVIAAILLALGQVVYVYRLQVAAQAPALRPLLERACAELGCTVPYTRDLTRLSVTESSLSGQATAGQAGGAQQTMLFEATLRNDLDAPQQWPVLWIALTDMSGAVVSRRHLPAEAYMGSASLPPAIAAASEQRIRLPLAVQAGQVSGYRVGLFFP